MSRLGNGAYLEDLRAVLDSECIDWQPLRGARVMVSGATGAIGTFLVDLLMAGRREGMGMEVISLGRDEARARERLPYFDEPGFSFEEMDISVPGIVPRQDADVIVHLASTTHPRAYATQPIGTITSNVIGLSNLLEHARTGGQLPGMLFASSVEVYGENRGDVQAFGEDYCGYLNCNTLRAGYPESKRVGESLCQAYAAERGVLSCVPRLPRVYGPTMTASDSKAISQFVRSSVSGEDIVLKSEGTQLYSYGYVADVVCGMLVCLTRGEAGQAYNVCGGDCDITLRDLARCLAELGGGQLRFELPDAVERAGYSTATTATLDGTKISHLGFTPRYGVREGLARTVSILRDLERPDK